MWPFKRKKKKEKRSQAYWDALSQQWEDLASQAAKDGTEYVVERGEGYSMARYEKDGDLDYATYLAMQEAGNKAKLNNVYASQPFIEQIAADFRQRLGRVDRILCHGTRNGTEQRWFKELFPDAEVIGTEIASTADQFPMTVQWDFHDINDDWLGYWDVIFSNSWDHSFSPTKMFDAWARSLRPGGLMYLEHTKHQEMVDKLDLFGATPEALRKIVEDQGMVFKDVLTNERPAGKSKGLVRKALVFERAAPE